MAILKLPIANTTFETFVIRQTLDAVLGIEVDGLPAADDRPLSFVILA